MLTPHKSIHHQCIQGSEEWLRLRLGIPTASGFEKIITPKGVATAKAGREDYACKLVAEILLNRPVAEISTPWMERGKVIEEEAVMAYEFITGQKTDMCGFFTDENHTFGASPDRLVGKNGLLQIKCPKENTQVKYMWKRNVEDKYKVQLQGELFVTGKEWVDIVSYHPELEPVQFRVARDKEFIQKLACQLDKFRTLMNEIILQTKEEIPSQTILAAG